MYDSDAVKDEQAIGVRRRAQRAQLQGRLPPSELLHLIKWEVYGTSFHFSGRKGVLGDATIVRVFECLIILAASIIYSPIECSIKWGLNRVGEIHGVYSDRGRPANGGETLEERAKRLRKEHKAALKRCSGPQHTSRKRKFSILPASQKCKSWVRKDQWKKNPTSDQMESPLLRLPYEVRAITWQYAIESTKPIHIMELPYEHGRLVHALDDNIVGREKSIEHPARYGFFKSALEEGYIMSLLLSCRQVYSEVISLIYTANTFLFDNIHVMISFSRALPPHHLRLIQKAVLYFDEPNMSIPRDSESLKHLRDSMERMTALKDLKITIVWHLGQRTGEYQQPMGKTRSEKRDLSIDVYLDSRCIHLLGLPQERNMEFVNGIVRRQLGL